MANPVSQWRISEERLEIIEKQAHQSPPDALLIELCREIRRLQARVAELAEEKREWLGRA